MIVTGGCHCGAVRFAADVPPDVELLDCNCSICAKAGYLHLNVLHSAFELISGRDHLRAYRVGTGKAEHLFCHECGVKSFYQPRSHPDCWSVNFRCLDPGHGLTPTVRHFDGQNWERAKAAL